MQISFLMIIYEIQILLVEDIIKCLLISYYKQIWDQLFLLMHIKTFLKKITDRPLEDNFQPINLQRLRRQHRKLQEKYSINGKLINDTSYISNKNENAMKYIEHHNPCIKSRIVKSRQEAISPETKLRTTFFREKIQKKLCQLMNEKKDLVITRSRISHSSLNYRSQKTKKQQLTNRQIPQFVQNIMKPCKIKSMSIIKRPPSQSRLLHVKSEPKIYPKQQQGNKNIYCMSKKRLSHYQKIKKRILQQQIKIGGWIDTNAYQQSAQLWVT